MKFVICALMLFISNTMGLTTPPVSKVDAKSFSKFISEAEIKHGRVAMLSAVTIPTLELFNGNQPGINELSHQDLTFQLLLLGIFGVSEFCQLLKAYQYPMDPMNWFKLKDEHVPGEYNFDPLNLTEKISFSKVTAKDIELSNGRLAMLAAFGMLVQELCTDKTILDTLVGGFN